ncbi:hypothetical protein BHYA_0006g00210 [Botrytis hyacinthi]|uniref:3'-5' exonuclease domain-containing protein n=1 Tax=Botrytis hyacinthi TaxID=278943 RepID=A0A4Z1H421_9HELO|nr:hypothetical protein BHYA_0006g00210 [Botrytis hyacinthi]
MLAEEERDLASCNRDSSEDLGIKCFEFDWDGTPNSDDSWPQSHDSWERQPMVSFDDEYKARMAALDQEAEDALNTGAKRSPDAPAPVVFVDTLEKMDKFLPVQSRLKDGVELAFDCEGTPEEDENGEPIPGGGFGHTGDISFLSMTVISIDITYVFDLWWDVRSDWDTLCHKFGIKIGKVRDVQLMGPLSRSGRKSNIIGLYKIMKFEGYFTMSSRKLNTWLNEKASGGAYFKRNGWRPLTTRPLTRPARNYIAGDTEYLYGLHKRLQNRLKGWLEVTQGKTVGGLMDAIGKPSTLLATTDDLMQFIDEQSMIRAHFATSPGFDSKFRKGKANAPAAFLRISDLWEENQDRMSKRQEDIAMSEKVDSSEIVNKHAGTSSGASEQELDIPSTQQEQIEPSVLSDIQADDSNDNDTTLAVGWPSSPTMENQADTVAADWSDRNDDPQDDMGPTAVVSTDTEAEDWDNVTTTDNGSWEYMPAREATFTESALLPYRLGRWNESVSSGASSIQDSWRQELFCGCKGNGVGLSRDGAITFFTMTIRSLNTTYTFDVQVLGDQVFNMVGNNASVRKNQAGESRMNDPTMWRGYSGKWSSKKKKVKDYLDWNGFEALEIRPVNSIVLLGCRIDTEILPELFDHLLQRLWETTNEMKMESPELFFSILREESWIRAYAVWSRESSNFYVAGICREIRNHPRTRSPPIFTMLPQVITGIREDEYMVGFE